MYWDGKKEVTKERVREILTEEFKKNNVEEFWVRFKDDFENVLKRNMFFTVSKEAYDASRCDACFTLEDREIYNGMFMDLHDGSLVSFRKLYPEFTLMYKDGEWLDAK